jgi:PEGA domain-containing protein
MRFASVLAAAMVCIAVDARAEPADADALIKHGLELRRQQRDAEALEEFRRAYAARPTARAMAQIAFAEQALGKWVEAERDLQVALAERDDPWIAHNLPLLQRGLSTIEGHLGWLEIAADVSPADLWINGVDLGVQTFPRRLLVEAGSVDVELRAPGYETARRITSVDAGGSSHETIHLVPAALPPPERSPAAGAPATSGPAPGPPPPIAPAPAPTPPEERRPDAAMRNAGFVSLGAGVLALGMGAYFGLRTLSTKSRRDQACPQASCPPEGVILDDQARSEALASTVWFAGGILATAAGVTLLWVSRSGTHPARSGVLRVTPMVGADRAGAQLGGNW